VTIVPPCPAGLDFVPLKKGLSYMHAAWHAGPGEARCGLPDSAKGDFKLRRPPNFPNLCKIVARLMDAETSQARTQDHPQ
jgi:hypothetical protein